MLTVNTSKISNIVQNVSIVRSFLVGSNVFRTAFGMRYWLQGLISSSFKHTVYSS